MAQPGVFYQAKNISATTATFTLAAGVYGIEFNATWSSGSVTLEKLSIDGTTYITVLPAFTGNGCVNGYLTEGTYKLVVVSATGVYVNISRIFVRQ